MFVSHLLGSLWWSGSDLASSRSTMAANDGTFLCVNVDHHHFSLFFFFSTYRYIKLHAHRGFPMQKRLSLVKHKNVKEFHDWGMKSSGKTQVCSLYKETENDHHHRIPIFNIYLLIEIKCAPSNSCFILVHVYYWFDFVFHFLWLAHQKYL